MMANSTNQIDKKRERVSTKITEAIQVFFRGIDPRSLVNYTYSQERSHFPHSSSDYEVFDETGKLVFVGRQYHGGHLAFWKPTLIATVPEWATSAASSAANAR
jgi:hypothetical protein